MSKFNDVKIILCSVLQITSPSTTFTINTPLIGAIPEFDSMAVVSVITALEEQFGFLVDDDEIDTEVFQTVGSLVAFVERKTAEI